MDSSTPATTLVFLHTVHGISTTSIGVQNDMHYGERSVSGEVAKFVCAISLESHYMLVGCFDERTLARGGRPSWRSLQQFEARGDKWVHIAPANVHCLEHDVQHSSVR